MGFFKKAMNWIRGKGFKEDEIKTEETTKEEEIKIPEPPKPIENISKNKEEKAEEEIETKIEEAKEESDKKELERIKTETKEYGYEEVQKGITQNQKRYKGIKTIEQINQETTENINNMYEHSTYFNGEMEGVSYAQHMKNAILQRQVTVDEQLAELIVSNAEKMKGRFTTIIEIETTDGAITEIVCAGELISDVHPVLEEAKEAGEINIEDKVNDSGGMFTVVGGLIDRLHDKGINAKFGRQDQISKGDIEIKDIRIKTNFN